MLIAIEKMAAGGLNCPNLKGRHAYHASAYPQNDMPQAAVGGCTCGPAVQVGDRAMLPASMLCDS